MTAQAEFTVRSHCIACGATELATKAKGRFTDDPLRGYLEADPWGVSPMPHLQEATWDLVDCQACGTMFHRNVLTDAWLGVYYSEWITAEAIEAYSAGTPPFRRAWARGEHHAERTLQLEKLTRSLRPKDAAPRLLDFGCGDGSFLALAAGFGFECVGVEFSAARERDRQIDFHPDLASVAAHDPEPFHAAVLFEVLEHLARPLDVLKDVAARLVPGGILVLETPDATGVAGITNPRDYSLAHPLGHINCFTPDSQAKIAEAAGFALVKSPGTVQLTADPKRVVKREVRRVLAPVLSKSTQQVFRKVAA